MELAKVLASLDHPNIPKYLNYFTIDSDSDRYFYLVQELVVGESLAQMVERGWHGTDTEIKQIAEQILEVLVYLHRLHPPVIHRDIKPQNVIRRTDGKIMLVDFGAVQAVYRQTQVAGSTVVGTYGYMAPEQYRGKAVPQTDLYGLGATILFLLTGRSPAELPEEKLKINFRRVINIDPNFANWLDKMLEPAVEDRFSSAQVALAQLKVQPSSLVETIEPLPVTRKPIGSKIELYHTPYSLDVKIPAQFKQFILLLTGIAFVLIGLFMLFNFGILRAPSFAMPGIFVFVAVFLFSGLKMLISLLKTGAFARTTLHIDDRQFYLVKDWRIGLKQVHKGNTIDLMGIENHLLDIEMNKLQLECLQLNHGVIGYKFGIDLTRVEREWLQSEIKKFLAQLKSR